MIFWEEAQEALRLTEELHESDTPFGGLQSLEGVGAEVWAPKRMYDRTMRREQVLKAVVVESTESENRSAAHS